MRGPSRSWILRKQFQANSSKSSWCWRWPRGAFIRLSGPKSNVIHEQHVLERCKIRRKRSSILFLYCGLPGFDLFPSVQEWNSPLTQTVNTLNSEVWNSESPYHVRMALMLGLAWRVVCFGGGYGAIPVEAFEWDLKQTSSRQEPGLFSVGLKVALCYPAKRKQK